MMTHNYARNLRPILLLLALALAFTLLVIAVNSSEPSFAQVGSEIDNFNDDQGPVEVLYTGPGSIGNSDWSAANCGANCVGGEREIGVVLIAGSTANTTRIHASTSGGEYAHSSDTQIQGTSRLIYDGPDASPNLDCIGLLATASHDLTFGNTVNAFQWNVISIDAGMDIKIKLYDMSDVTCNTWSEVVLSPALPAGQPELRYFEYAAFFEPAGMHSNGSQTLTIVHNGGGLSAMSNVGAIEIDIIGGPNGDMTLDDLTTNAFDWGDLPNTYKTRILDHGPRHLIGGPQLGSAIDPSADGGEINGQPSAAADGDNTNLSGTGGTAPGPENIGDEDGVTRAIVPTFPTLWEPGNIVQIFVEVSGTSGHLACWMDWNNDGDFDTLPSELAVNQSVTVGSNTVLVIIDPSYTTGDPLGVRCRIWSTTPGAADLVPTGRALDGEVEDYLWTHTTNEVTLSEFDAASSVPVAAFAGIGVAILLLAGAGFGLARRRR